MFTLSTTIYFRVLQASQRIVFAIFAIVDYALASCMMVDFFENLVWNDRNFLNWQNR